MLVTPRTYQLAQKDTDRWNHPPDSAHLQPRFHTLTGWHADKAEAIKAYKMLLVHQSGFVRVGEVVRYTFTYTPSLEQILPAPTELHVRVKNTSAIPLRAAYLHGPYSLYTACSPADFDPNQQYHDSGSRGIPQFEPYLKAGGSFVATIPVPEETRLTAERTREDDRNVGLNSGSDGQEKRSITWVIEIASQVIFSGSAVVHFELLIGRDQKSLDFGINGSLSFSGMPPPADISEHLSLRSGGNEGPVIATKGVFSKSVTLVFDDAKSLWNTPECPSFKEREAINSKLQTQSTHNRSSNHAVPSGLPSGADEHDAPSQKKKRLHLVMLTHGLHGNLGADMLYLKEAIDAAAKGANQAKKQSSEANMEEDNEEQEEEIIVRGFHGNVTRTERGIQYLGKRLAKYVLLMTYPDQPCLPIKKKKNKSGASTRTSIENRASSDTLYGQQSDCQVTSISFIGHSLGGLVQTYAIAYIQKHSPEFFDRIKPINFVALATPFLGLSNENPVYVRFALDLGLVGKTGQDLGLSWMSPRVGSRWDSIISKFAGNSGPSQQQQAPASKPLLRILPAGPAHQVLLKFRNRTVYSNVVNDGIVPLRTSCLLFLDWRGLDRVQKARRDNGLVGTMAEWGWAELTGANTSPHHRHQQSHHKHEVKSNTIAVQDPNKRQHIDETTPTQKSHDEANLPPMSPEMQGPILGQSILEEPEPITPMSSASGSAAKEPAPSPSPFNHFLTMFQSNKSRGSSSSKKSTKIIQRSQTIPRSSDSTDNIEPVDNRRSRVRGDSLYDEEDVRAPPRTTIFESAGDVLRPPLPPTEFIINPASRPRTIFHDRIYHPEDIPPPIFKKRGTIFSPSRGSQTSNQADVDMEQVAARGFSGSGLKVEEKIARAYHHEVSWRKVLVRLEPDAHNNIVVRRMFANAYGWPVVKHLVDNHFGNTYSARTEDALESNEERAKPLNYNVTESGEETFGRVGDNPPPEQQQHNLPHRPFAYSETHSYASLPPESNEQGAVARNANDVDDNKTTPEYNSHSLDRQSRKSSDSAQWTDRYFSGNDSASEAQSDRE